MVFSLQCNQSLSPHLLLRHIDLYVMWMQHCPDAGNVATNQSFQQNTIGCILCCCSHKKMLGLRCCSCGASHTSIKMRMRFNDSYDTYAKILVLSFSDRALYYLFLPWSAVQLSFEQLLRLTKPQILLFVWACVFFHFYLIWSFSSMLLTMYEVGFIYVKTCK